MAHKEIISILLLFLAAQVLGLFVGSTLVQQAQIYPEFEALNVAPAGADSAASALLFIAYVLVGATVLLLLMKFYKGMLLFKLMEAAIVFTASYIVFSILLLAFGIPYYVGLSILLSASLAAAKFFLKGLKNLVAVIASAGVGAIFGFSLDPVPAIAFMVGLSLYDIWAVFGTRHMIVMARELGGRNLAFSVGAESIEKVRVPVPLSPKEIRMGTPQKFKEETRRSSLELGTGDIAIPLMLAVSASKTGSLLAPFAIIAASTLALYFVLWYVLEKRAFLPALPPLSAAAIIAFSLVRLAGL